MFQQLSMERIALVLFTGALTLIAATTAFARPALMPDSKEKMVASPVYQSMTCREAHDKPENTFNAKFVNFLRADQVSEGGSVTTEMLGTCFANAPASSYAVSSRKDGQNGGGQLDIHSFSAGGNSCNAKEGEVTFELFHDRTIGQSRSATLTIKNFVFNCEL
jgi:uncharacterized protein (DUF2141 family)